jgi:hypothetical protein
MISNVDTLLKQARAHSSNDNSNAALILLRRAEQLAQSDSATLAIIYFEMAKLYGQAADDRSCLSLVKKAIQHRFSRGVQPS